MRTSLNEIRLIENQLFGINPPGDQLLFEAKIILNNDFGQNVDAQTEAYRLIKNYGRNQLKAELEVIHQKLFNEARHMTFANRIRKIFQR